MDFLRLYVPFLLVLLLCALPLSAESQDTASAPPTLRIPRSVGKLKIDGRLDEPAWSSAAMTARLIQREPHEGEPASEGTEIRVMYDEHALYISFRCFDSEVLGIAASEMRRDAVVLDNDCVEVYLDTYHDHRTAYYFATNALGVQRDGIITADAPDEEQNWDWNGVWENASVIDSLGWTAEIAIPFQTLRFRGDSEMVWGMNFARLIPRKREEAYWARILRDYGFAGKYRISAYGHLEGLQSIQHPGTFEYKPFVLGGVQRDFENNAQYEWKRGVGIDAKFHVTPNITADISWNTDFAQVEADQEQTNLTRFELLFPEKRDFFLEGASIFRFGERTYSPLMPSSVLFFSRRIGLSEDNTLIPLLGGVKVTGKQGGTAIGLLNMTAERTSYLNDNDEHVSVPMTNFGIVRLRQDILENSSIGLIGLNKQSLDNAIYNRAVGVDANFYLSPNTQIGGFVAKSFSPGKSGNDMAAYGDFVYSDDFWTLFLNHNSIQDDFNPEMGYFQRTGIQRSEVSFGISPRPKMLNLRQVTLFNDLHYIVNQQGELEARYSYVGFYSQFQDGATWFALASWNMEHLTEEFEISDSVTILPGTYRYAHVFSQFDSDKSEVVSGSVIGRIGQFYDGRIAGLGGSVNVKIGSHLTCNLQFERNVVDVSAGAFSTNIVGTRIIYSFTPKLFAKAFLQWNSEKDEAIANVLINFIHTPGSDLYVVYNDEMSTRSGSLASKNRTLLVKFTYLFNL